MKEEQLERAKEIQKRISILKESIYKFPELKKRKESYREITITYRHEQTIKCPLNKDQRSMITGLLELLLRQNLSDLEDEFRGL